MKNLLELIKALYGPKAISSTIGTRTNVIRLPSGKLQKYLSTALNIEAASDNAAVNAYNEMKELIPEVAKMNDAERLIFEGNLGRLKNKLESSGILPKQTVAKEGEVVSMETKEPVTGESLKKLTEEQGTINPPTTVAGRLEQSAKKLEKLGKNVEEEFVKGKKRSVSEILDEYFSSYSTMKQIEDQGLVRAVARQIMYADLQSGKLKVPKEVEDTIRGMTAKDVLDDFSQWYGAAAVEDLYENADKFYKMASPQEAVKFLKENKYSNWENVYQPREKPIKEYMEPEEFRDMLSKMAYNRKGMFVEPGSEKLDAKTLDEIKTYYSKEKPEVVANEIKRMEEGQIFKEFPEEDRKTILQTLLDLIKKGSPTIAGGVGLEYLAEKATPQIEGGTQQSLGLDYLTGMEPSDGYANGGRIGFKTGSGKKILDLINKANKELKGKKSMETVNPKTGEVTVPTEPVQTAERKSIYYDVRDEFDKLKSKHKIAAAAHDELPSIDLYDKIAADQLAEVMAEMKGKDFFNLSQKQQMEYYKKAQNYIDDLRRIDRTSQAVKKYNSGAELGVIDKRYLDKINPVDLSDITQPQYTMVGGKKVLDATHPDTIQSFSEFAKATDPEGYAEFSKKVDRINELSTMKKNQKRFEQYSLEDYKKLNSTRINELLNDIKNPPSFLEEERNIVTNAAGKGLKNYEDIQFKVDKETLQKHLEDLLQQKQIEEAQVELGQLKETDRKPNASGGLNYLMGL